MAADVNLILAAVVMVIIVGPLLFGLAGLVRTRREPTVVAPKWNWTLTIASALLYTLAFNLTFFVQELLLVLPKAFTPGLRPTLFHNNHSWDGEHALANLFQGTGALATFILAGICVVLLRRDTARSPTARLFLIWMAYNGFFQALPQVVIGAINPQNDVGMAMDYFGLGATAKTVFAFAALIAMPFLSGLLTKFLLTLANSREQVASGRARARFIFLAATLPAFTAIALIVPYRVPRDLIEVVLLPLIVTICGLMWMQASAWRVHAARVANDACRWPLGGLLVAATALLMVFQLVLRPGIQFF